MFEFSVVNIHVLFKFLCWIIINAVKKIRIDLIWFTFCLPKNNDLRGNNFVTMEVSIAEVLQIIFCTFNSQSKYLLRDCLWKEIIPVFFLVLSSYREFLLSKIVGQDSSENFFKKLFYKATVSNFSCLSRDLLV